MIRIQWEKMLEQETDQWLALALPPRSQVYAFAKVGGRPRCPNCGTVVGRLAGGAPKSWPDRLIIVWGYRDIYIELKRLGGKASPDQLAMHDELREHDKLARDVAARLEIEKGKDKG